MIPVEIDVVMILEDLNSWGWKDYKIELVCGFSPGYACKLRDGTRPNRPYAHVARLYNFWEDETASRQCQAQTTSAI